MFRNRTPSRDTLVQLKDVLASNVKKEAEHLKIRAKEVASNAGKRFWQTRMVTQLLPKYEDFLGITEVKRSQEKVVKYQTELMELSATRRQRQEEINSIQTELREIHAKISKTARMEDRYLELVTQEHNLIKRERSLVDSFKLVEESERHAFSMLSFALQENHEQGRLQTERSKYLSIIGSLIGATLGIIGTTYSYSKRRKELRSIIDQVSQVQGNKVDEVLCAQGQSTKRLLEDKFQAMLCSISTLALTSHEQAEPPTSSDFQVTSRELLVSPTPTVDKLREPIVIGVGLLCLLVGIAINSSFK